MTLQRQLTKSKQLVKVLSERAARFQQNADLAAAGSFSQQQQSQAQGDFQSGTASHADVDKLTALRPVSSRNASAFVTEAHGSCNTAPSSSAFAGASPQLVAAEASEAAQNAADGSSGQAASLLQQCTSKQRHLQLLQHALYPLTRCPKKGKELPDDDLCPHAEPKAKQVYDKLVSTAY